MILKYFNNNYFDRVQKKYFETEGVLITNEGIFLTFEFVFVNSDTPIIKYYFCSDNFEP